MKQKTLGMVIRLLINAEYIIHILVALLLLIATFGIFFIVFKDITTFDETAVLKLINYALLMLIVKEVLWTVVKFLKKQSFSVSSFLFIGVISGIRQMLYLEIQKSVEKAGHDWFVVAELGVNALVIFVLIAAYYLLRKADSIEKMKTIE
ncbi:phosphate-starvation-inducible PsiE family protein [Thermincola potens]|uniref:Phosphate-starvation-inducible E-like protein n=1 Tax=Thermincola potens (strain JR) TaxID=635013 RepID=D5XA23_THEPJ|nr:phosphate-starvation-inducible PsiE family protein [Thermincola potens]ADG83156.1 conserved hypothetical protein [Thermincola potens JR]